MGREWVREWGGSEGLGEACPRGSRTPKVMERHGGGLVQGGGLPRLYLSLTPQSGAERAGQALGASHVFIN